MPSSADRPTQLLARADDPVADDPIVRLWCALDDEPRLARDLAEKSGTNTRAAGQRLRRLVRTGFARTRGEVIQGNYARTLYSRTRKELAP